MSSSTLYKISGVALTLGLVALGLFIFGAIFLGVGVVAGVV